MYDLFNQPAEPQSMPQFNGSDYTPELDHARLGKQITDIYNLMEDGKWRTLREIEQATGHPQASCSAQLRHLRKERFGAHQVNKQRRETEPAEKGVFEYQLIANKVTS